MPHNPRSLQVAQAFRRRVAEIGQRAEQRARATWFPITELDTTDWPERMAAFVTQAQIEGLRADSGYLAAYYRSETGRRIPPPTMPRETVGLARNGRPLTETFTSPLIGVKAALKEGRDVPDALRLGLVRATRMAGFETVQAAREALLDAIDADERFSGWQRTVSGTCAACEALSADGGPRFEVHPNCECQPAPVVRGLADRFPIPTGAALFAAKTQEEQDAAIGPEAAEKVRTGQADLKDFVGHSPQATQPDYLTQKPAQDAA